MVKTNSVEKNKNLKAQSSNLPIHKKIFGLLQRIGKALLFPIAMLPLAAIFLRIGAQMSNSTEFSTVIKGIFDAIGNAVFGNLALLFAVGVAFGLSKDMRGESAITGFVVFMLLTYIMGGTHLDLSGHIYSGVDLGGSGKGTGFHKVFSSETTPNHFKDSYDAILSGNVLMGITVGGTVAFTYNKFAGLEMPSILGFFSGRRLIPVLGLLAGTLVGIIWAILFPWVGFLLYLFSDALVSGQGNRWGNAGIMGVYGMVNRLLIPFGLHHVPNTLFWFSALGGTGTNAAGTEFAGDINVFLNAAPKGNVAGTFQSGFFPVMMFGLPALATAMWFRADGDVQKKRVAALFMGSSIVSFFTGITEPIEFSFLFLAPALFGLHAILTGVFGFITGLFGIQLGFGFSAGLIDYALSIPKSLDIISANKTGIDAVMANPAWLMVIGAGAATTYFFAGSWMIKKFNLNTPGRGTNKLGSSDEDESKGKAMPAGSNKFTKDAMAILKAVGGKSNIKELGNCATRLRFVLKDNKKVNADGIKGTKALGQMKVAGGYQVIMGPTVEMYANEIQALMDK